MGVNSILLMSKMEYDLLYSCDAAVLPEGTNVTTLSSKNTIRGLAEENGLHVGTSTSWKDYFSAPVPLAGRH